MRSEPITRALDELGRARANVKAIKNRQVRSMEDRASLRSTALAWFHSHRPAVLQDSDPDALSAVDAAYHVILDGSERSTTRRAYLDAMTNAKEGLLLLRKQLVVVVSVADAAPDFTPLAGNGDMQRSLNGGGLSARSASARRLTLPQSS